MTPRNLKQAMGSSNYVLRNVYDRGNKQIRIDFERRGRGEGKPMVSFWIDRVYFTRTYPTAAERNCI